MLFEEMPHTGTLQVEARLEKVANQRFVTVDFHIFYQQRLVCKFQLIAILLPKGSLLDNPPIERRAFLLYKQYIPHLSISKFFNQYSELKLSDVEESEFLPGSLADIYKVKGNSPTELGVQTVLKEYAASQLYIHPADVVFRKSNQGNAFRAGTVG